MRKTITPGQISQTNMQLIYQYIYRNGPVSQQDIAYDLRLSRPTIASKVGELETLGMVRKDGQISSDLAGRKAAAYVAVPDHRIAVGVEIAKKEFKILIVDLRGNYSNRTVYPFVYENSETYISFVCEKINEFIASLPVSGEQILGIGFSFPGLVSADGTVITYGKILDCTGLSLTSFQKHLNYPCRFLHDAAAAAGSELWSSPELSDFVYLNVSVHLGAAMIYDRKILSGQHGYAATIEHVQVDSEGPVCYCGKTGCIETYCSMSALLGDEDAEHFFEQVRAGNSGYRERWETYLKYLARAITNTHLLYDTVYVIGGYLAPHIEEEDIAFLYEEVDTISPFPETHDFIRVSKMPKHNITIGAALPFIREFLAASWGQ